MARPTKLTPDLQKRICDDIARGISQEAAAGAAGIGERTLYDWLARGAEGKPPYAQFSQDLACARAENEAELLKLAGRHAITDPRMVQWLLSVKWPQRYGNLVKHELRFAGMTDAELDAYIAETERAAGAPGAGGAGAAHSPAPADAASD